MDRTKIRIFFLFRVGKVAIHIISGQYLVYSYNRLFFVLSLDRLLFQDHSTKKANLCQQSFPVIYVVQYQTSVAAPPCPRSTFLIGRRYARHRLRPRSRATYAFYFPNLHQVSVEVAVSLEELSQVVCSSLRRGFYAFIRQCFGQIALQNHYVHIDTYIFSASCSIIISNIYPNRGCGSTS